MDYNPVPLSLWGVGATAAAVTGVFLSFAFIWAIRHTLAAVLEAWRPQPDPEPLAEPQPLYPEWEAAAPPKFLVAYRHRCIRVGLSKTKRVFVHEYSDESGPYQTATYVSGRERRPVLGRFQKGPQGDEAILRLVSAST